MSPIQSDGRDLSNRPNSTEVSVCFEYGSLSLFSLGQFITLCPVSGLRQLARLSYDSGKLGKVIPWLSSLRLTSTKTIKMSIGVEGLGKQACYFLLSFLFLLFSRPTLSLWRKEEQLNISNKALVLHPLPSTLVVEIQVMISTLLIGDDLTELFFDNSLWKNGEWVHGSNEPTCLWCSTRPRAWRRLWSLFPLDRHRWPIFASFYWPFQEHCGQGDKSLVITFPCNWLRHRANWTTEALSKETRYVSP